MTATDELAYIASLEKELATVAEKLKVKRLFREEGLGRITELREEQGRLRHQISRLQAQQELSRRLDKLTLQIEAKKKRKALILSRLQGAERLNQKSRDKGEKHLGDGTTDNLCDTSFHSNHDLCHFLESEFDKEAQTNGKDFHDSGSYFSIPETRSVYEGFEFRDRELRSGGGASQSQQSAGSSTSGVNSSYSLPFSYSPALCSTKGKIEHEPRQLDIASTPSPWASFERSSKSIRTRISPTKHHAKEMTDQDDVAPVAPSKALKLPSPIVPRLVRQGSVSPAKRSSSTTCSTTSTSVAGSSNTFSSISSTFSPPLVWEHSSAKAPKSPGDFLLAKNSNVQLPSMLDAMLERSL